MITDSSAAFLRRGFLPTPPLPAAAFRNVSPINHRNRSNRVETIRCGRLTRPLRSGSQSGGFPLPNTNLALKTLLCFSDGGAAPADHLRAINQKKKEALQKLIAGNCVEAENIMRGVYEKYKGVKPLLIQYDAALALVEFLIHRGTKESWNRAFDHLVNLENMNGSLPSDAKLPLYKAILLTLLEDHDAKDSWSYYTSHIGSGPSRH